MVMTLARYPLCWDHALITDALEKEEILQLTAIRPKSPEKLHVIIDHDTPSGTSAVAEKQKILRNWAREYGIDFHYGAGIGYHCLMEDTLKPGETLITTGNRPGVVGAVGVRGIHVDPADFITAIGTGVVCLPVSDPLHVRLTGALSYQAEAKDVALHLRKSEHTRGKFLILHEDGLFDRGEKTCICALLSGSDGTAALFTEEEVADGTEMFELNLGNVRPQYLVPDSEEIRPTSETDGIRVNQVFIGGCQGGTIEALRTAAAIWKGKTVSRYVRVMVAPVTAKVYSLALDEGLIEVFMDANVLVMNQGCSACWAKSQGRCSENEIFVTTGSYNCRHWVSKADAKIYISSVKKAATAALTGTLYEY